MNRHREREFPTSTALHTKTLNEQVYNSAETVLFSHFEAMDDVLTPNFKRRSESGEIIINPVTYGVQKLSAGYGSYLAEGYGNTFYASGGSQTLYQIQVSNALVGGAISPTESYDMLGRAKLQALANIDASPYALMEDAFEIRETLRFLRNPLGSIATLSKAFKKAYLRRRGSGFGVADAISDAWLQYRFAFSPLMRSAMDIAEGFNKEWTIPQWQTARGFAADKDTAVDSPRHYYTGAIYDEYHRSQAWNILYRAGIIYRVENPVNDATFKWGFRVKDIPETVWAVIPYSFMVDRVANLSDSIRALTNLLDPNVEIIDGWYTKRVSTKTSVRHSSQNNPGYTIAVSGDDAVWETFTLQRQSWKPTVSDVVPPVTLGELIKDATSIADLLALVYKNLRP